MMLIHMKRDVMKMLYRLVNIKKAKH